MKAKEGGRGLLFSELLLQTTTLHSRFPYVLLLYYMLAIFLVNFTFYAKGSCQVFPEILFDANCKHCTILILAKALLKVFFHCLVMHFF